VSPSPARQHFQLAAVAVVTACGLSGGTAIAGTTPRVLGTGSTAAHGVAGTHASFRRTCGVIVTKRFGRLRVYVASGSISCAHARRVIRYVSRHGTPTQGSPGDPPRGWNCGWGYVREGSDTVRGGPACNQPPGSSATTVEGLVARYPPA